MILNSITQVTNMNAIKLHQDLNIVPLLKEVVQYYDDFLIHTTRQENIPCQSETMTINLVHGLPTESKELMDSDQLKMTDHAHKYKNCWSFIDWFKAMYGGNVFRIAIVLIPPDKQVYPHIDFGEYYANKDRFHLVLSGGYDLTVDNETHRLDVGDFCWFNNKKMHSVKNATPMPRLAMILDVEGSLWRNKFDNM